MSQTNLTVCFTAVQISTILGSQKSFDSLLDENPKLKVNKKHLTNLKKHGIEVCKSRVYS